MILPTVTPTASEALVSMIQKARAGVVRIETGGSTGSGVIFERKGDSGAALILTNNHVVEVVEEGPSNIKVTVNDSTTYEATVVGIDVEKDLAVLQVCCGVFTVLPFGDAETLQVGSDIIAMGYSLGLAGPATTTSGIVSGFRHDTQSDRRLIQTDAPINPGNSGGPILTLTGEVIGLNTFKIAGFLYEGLGFAVSEQTLQEQLPRLKMGGDALDVANVMAQWTYGPAPGSAFHNVRIPSYPWVLEWTLEQGGTLLQISGLGESGVEVMMPGTGRIAVFEYGRFPLTFKAEGKYTVAIKTATASPRDAVNVMAQWTYGPVPGSARHVFHPPYPWVLEWTLDEGGTLLQISNPKILGLSKNWVETTTPGSGKIVVFENGPSLLDFKSEGEYTVAIKTASASPRDAVNVLAQWTFGPDPINETLELNIYEMPWVLEWSVEEARSPIQISVAKRFSGTKIYESDWSRYVFATQPGSGMVADWDIGRFAFEFKGEGQFTVVVKTR